MDRNLMKEKMLEIIKEAETIDEMAPQDLKKYMKETFEIFTPEEIDDIDNIYVFKSGILAGKLTILKSYIETL